MVEAGSPFLNDAFKANLQDWLEAGATAKERDSTMRVLKSSLQFTPISRPRTSGGRPGAGAVRQDKARDRASMGTRPHSMGTADGPFGDFTSPIDTASKPKPLKSQPSKTDFGTRPSNRPSPGLPPKPPSPVSVLEAERAMQSPVTSRPPSQGNRDVVGGVLSVGNAKQEIFSERPMTAKSVEQRFPLRPATSGMLRPTNRPFDGVPIIGRQTLVPSAIASLKGPGYTQQGQPPGPRGTIKPGSKLGAAEDKPISSVPAEHEVTVPKEHKRETEILQPKFDAQEPEVEMRFMDPTTNTLHFSMREMVPEIYQEMLDVSRSQQIDNRNFVSHYELGGDGFPMFWKNTTYGEANEQAAAAITDNSAAQDRSFINWVQRQKLYYGDVLTKEAQAQVEQWLLTATDEEKNEFLQTFRLIHSSTDPDRHKSISHLHYNQKRNPMMAEDLNLIFEENRCATYGRPKIRDVNITVGRPGTAPVNRPKGQSDHLPSLDKAEMEQLKKDLNLKKELYESKVPLKWACSNLGPVESSYGAAYGANMPELRRYILEADKQKVSRMRPLGLGPTLGFGGVDPLIYQHKTTAFPVAGCFTQPLRPSSDVDLLKLTTYEVLHGMSAPKTRANLTAEEREALAKLAAIEAIRMRESQDRVKRSYIPLGSSAMHNQSDPKTMNQTMFCSYPEEAYMRALKADSATRMKRAFTGATASVAACAPAQGTNLATSELLTRRTRGE